MLQLCNSVLFNRRIHGTPSASTLQRSNILTAFCRAAKMPGLILLLLACALNLFADPTNNAPPKKIGATEATNYFDQTMTVTGTVAQVTIRPSVVFLNMDHPYPNSPFTLVIFSGNASKFGNLKSLNGKDIQATGKIKKFHDKPEMVLESTNQLKVLPTTAAK